MEFKIEQEASHFIKVDKIIRVNVGKENCGIGEFFNVKIYFGKECYSSFKFPTFEMAKKFSTLIIESATPFIDCISVQNDLLKNYVKHNDENSIYYKPIN